MAEVPKLVTAQPGYERWRHGDATYPLYCDNCGQIQHPIVNDCASEEDADG